MGRTTRTQRLDLIFVLVVFCVFAVSVLVVLTLGGIIYKGVSERIEQSYDERTALSYIWSKVKNSVGTVRTGDFQGLNVLCLVEEYDSVNYVTMIYLYDGWIRELVSEEGLDFLPEDGMPIIETESLSFSDLQDGLVKVSANSGTMYIYPRIQPSG